MLPPALFYCSEILSTPSIGEPSSVTSSTVSLGHSWKAGQQPLHEEVPCPVHPLWANRRCAGSPCRDRAAGFQLRTRQCRPLTTPPAAAAPAFPLRHQLWLCQFQEPSSSVPARSHGGSAWLVSAALQQLLCMHEPSLNPLPVSAPIPSQSSCLVPGTPPSGANCCGKALQHTVPFLSWQARHFSSQAMLLHDPQHLPGGPRFCQTAKGRWQRPEHDFQARGRSRPRLQAWRFCGGLELSRESLRCPQPCCGPTAA